MKRPLLNILIYLVHFYRSNLPKLTYECVTSLVNISSDFLFSEKFNFFTWNSSFSLVHLILSLSLSFLLFPHKNRISYFYKLFFKRLRSNLGESAQEVFSYLVTLSQSTKPACILLPQDTKCIISSSTLFHRWQKPNIKLFCQKWEMANLQNHRNRTMIRTSLKEA